MDVSKQPDETRAEHVVAVLRERIYGTVACLSTLLVLLDEPDAEASARTAVIAVAVTNGSLWAASVFADVVAQLMAHGRVLRSAEALRAIQASGQILEASAVPLLLLIVAGAGGMSLHTALQAGIWICVAGLGLFALLAARRAPLPWWKRALLVASLVALGMIVVGVETLAHR